MSCTFFVLCDFQPAVFSGSSRFVGGHVRNVHVSSSATGIVGLLLLLFISIFIGWLVVGWLVVGWLVGRSLVVTRMHCGQTVHPRPIVTMEH